ncbi:MAG: peptide chain release factor N(5)-glutamine methyltransferase [Deltaproteobacteria bacterium]|nr:peptide chain release factor N(5)-glutamine methyltransferase [Deltaproteobacteria bacterium]
MAHAFQCDRLRAHLALADFRKFVKRRAAGEPVAYITGVKEFYGHEFEVNSDVLIPRPDTEKLVELALKRLDPNQDYLVADICTGSGCVGITLALERPRVRVIATEICPKAAEVARCNAEKLGVADRFEVRAGNLLEPLCHPAPPHCHPALDAGSSAGPRIKCGVTAYDLLVSNPPYIKAADMPGLMKDVRDFEPHLALQGTGELGTDLHEEIIQQAPKLLKTGSFVLLEIGYDQGSCLRKLGKVYQDDAGNDRVVEIQCG